MGLVVAAVLICFGFLLVRMVHPRGHRRPWVVTLVFALLIAAGALILHVLPYLALIPLALGGAVAELTPERPEGR
jgi:hypothetical protein